MTVCVPAIAFLFSRPAELDRPREPLDRPRRIPPPLEVVVQECPQAKQQPLVGLPGDAEASRGAPECLVADPVVRGCDGARVEVRCFVREQDTGRHTVAQWQCDLREQCIVSTVTHDWRRARAEPWGLEVEMDVV